jgi:chromate transporter
VAGSRTRRRPWTGHDPQHQNGADIATEDSPPLSRPSTLRLFLSFLRLGAVSFGGPAMVAYIKRLAVARKAWLPEQEFQQGVALCQAVPGATAMQCAAFVGLRVRGLRGAVCTYLGFGLPAFLLMLSLSIAYEETREIDWVTSMLAGLRALVVALIAYAAWTFARSSVRGLREGAIAVATGVAFYLGVTPFLIVAAAGALGALLLRRHDQPPQTDSLPPVPVWRALRPAAFVLAFGALLVAVLLLVDRELARLGLVMMKVDVFAFGGGFASIPLMLREVVDVRHWIPASVFMDGIALGQVTPGPIVITATFVGYQVAGLAGAVVGTLGIFLPSLFAVVLVDPWFSRLQRSPVFRAATQGFVLSFVGLLASVTAEFARLMPWNAPSAIIAGLALAALLLKVDVLWVVLAGAVASALIM